MKYKTKKDLSEILKRAENKYGFEGANLPIEEALNKYLYFMYSEELYDTVGIEKKQIVEDIADIIEITNYEYRTNVSIISDVIYDGHQSLGELIKLGDDNPKKNYFDLLFKLRNKEGKNEKEIYHNFLINPPADIEVGNKPTQRAIGGNKMEKATEIETMKEYFETRLNTSENKTLIISEKLDGSSLYLTYNNNGKLIRAEQRGTDDKDTSLPIDKVLKIEGVKKEIDVSFFDLDNKETIELRGEVLIEKDKFKRINEEKEKKSEELFSNTRNAGSGILRDEEEKYTHELTFMGFEAYKIGDRTLKDIHTERILQKLKEEFFQKNNIKQPRIYNVKSWEEFLEIYQKYDVEDLQEITNYAMDGLIVTIDTNKIELNNRGEVLHSFGAKFSPTTELLKVVGVEKTVGKDGRISIVLKFEEKDVGGVNVSNSKLDSINAETPATFLKLFSIGDEALVGRMGDVIPKVMYNQKFRPFIKYVLNHLEDFFIELKKVEQSNLPMINGNDVIEEIIKILHLSKQTKVTSENKDYLLKYATIISELYVKYGNKLNGVKFVNKVLIHLIKEILKENKIKSTKYKIEAQLIKNILDKFDLSYEVDKTLIDGIDFGNSCPSCSKPLVGLKEKDKIIRCVNEDCNGIKKAVILGFVEDLSTRLDDKPKLKPVELYNYLKEKKYINFTKQEFLNLLKLINIKDFKSIKNIINNNELSLEEYTKIKDIQMLKRGMIKALESNGIISSEQYFEILNEIYKDKVISSKTIDFLYDNNIIDNTLDLMNLKEEDFFINENEYYEGFKKQKVNNILNQIKTIKQGNFDYNFAASLNIPNFGNSNAKLIFSVISFSKILQMDLNNEEAEKYLRETLLNIKGLGSIRVDNFIEYIKKNKEYIIELKNKFDLIETEIVDNTNTIPFKIVPTDSLNPGSLSNGISWQDRKSFKDVINKKIIEVNGTKYEINVTSKVGTKINHDKIEIMLSDTEGSRKGTAYQKKGGYFLTTKDLIEVLNGNVELKKYLKPLEEKEEKNELQHSIKTNLP